MLKKNSPWNIFELKRKAFHICLGIVLSLLIWLDLLSKEILLPIIVLGLTLSIIEKQRKLPFFSQLLDLFEREDTRKRLPGESLLLFLMGTYVLLHFFPKSTTLASLMILTFGDSAAHLFGVHFGRMKHPFTDKKFVEGMIAGMIAGFVPALLFVTFLEAFAGAVAAMLFEAVEVKFKWFRVDDNFTIPVVAALAITLSTLI